MPIRPEESRVVTESATSLQLADVVLDQLTIRVGERRLLSDVSVTIPAGKLSAIIGGSGAGKSVLLRLIAGLPTENTPIQTTGEIRIAGQHDDPQGTRCRVGIVFQSFALFDEWTAIDNVRFAADHRRIHQTPPVQSAPQWLAQLRVASDARPATMSGGQKQRLAIARTLAAQPNVVLYDEPTSGLDHATGQEVAALIQHTHRTHRQTSIVVTHDYDVILPIADHVFLFDSHAQRLMELPREEWNRIGAHMRPVAMPSSGLADTSTPNQASPDVAPVASFARGFLSRVDDLIRVVGRAVWASLGLVCLPWSVYRSQLRPAWALRFFWHFAKLIGGPSSWCYLAMAGAIAGFTSTYFTFRFLPFELYSKPLLIEDLLGSIGFAMYRILVPVLATILIAARCGAAVAADVGVRRYSAQIDALYTLGVHPAACLFAPVLAAFVIAAPLLQTLAYLTAKTVSLVVFVTTHPDVGPHFWRLHFYRNLDDPAGLLLQGTGWVIAKAVICGIGVASISYHQGLRPKQSAGDVSSAITSTVLWSTLYVLVVHFLIALIEF